MSSVQQWSSHYLAIVCGSVARVTIQEAYFVLSGNTSFPTDAISRSWPHHRDFAGPSALHDRFRTAGPTAGLIGNVDPMERGHSAGGATGRSNAI
jgi:hypothetical protein